MAKNPTFACCLCCRGVLQPAPEHSDSVENYNILVANVFFMKNAGINVLGKFCAKVNDSHVFQVAHVSDALQFWMQRIDTANTWDDIVGKVSNFDYRGTTSYQAAWEKPSKTHEFKFIAEIMAMGCKTNPQLFLATTLTCCHVCNAVMDVAARQNERFTSNDAIMEKGVIQVRFATNTGVQVDYPLEYTQKEKNNRLRSAFIAYYIHQCLAGTETQLRGALDPDHKQKLKYFVIFVWLLFIIVCKNQEPVSDTDTRTRRPLYNYQGNTEMYISWFMYIWARCSNNLDLPFEKYHMYLISELPFTPDWSNRRDFPSLSKYVFRGSGGSLSDCETRLYNLSTTYGMRLYKLGLGQPTALNTDKDKQYYVNKGEMDALDALQQEVRTTENPGAYIRLLGALPMLNPFYRNVDDDTLRNEVREFIRYHSKSDIARIRALGGEYARWSDARRKLLYQLQFLLEYDEAEVLRQARTLSVPELQRIVDTQPRCSTWKAALRVQRLFPVARAEYADAEAEE